MILMMSMVRLAPTFSKSSARQQCVTEYVKVEWAEHACPPRNLTMSQRWRAIEALKARASGRFVKQEQWERCELAKPSGNWCLVPSTGSFSVGHGGIAPGEQLTLYANSYSLVHFGVLEHFSNGNAILDVFGQLFPHVPSRNDPGTCPILRLVNSLQNRVNSRRKKGRGLMHAAIWLVCTMRCYGRLANDARSAGPQPVLCSRI